MMNASWPEDTQPEAERVLIQMLRPLPAWRKLEMVGQMTLACRELALAGLRRRYPTASPQEMRRRLAALLLDRETVLRVYGWDPNQEGY